MAGSVDSEWTTTHDTPAATLDDEQGERKKQHVAHTQVAQTLSSTHIQDSAGSHTASPSVDVQPSSARARSDESNAQRQQKQPSSMSSAHADLKPWPNIHSPNREEPLLLKTAAVSRENITSSSPSRHHPERPSPIPRTSSPTLAATETSYYESSQQPLSISQQTSASAVRDMALRKGSPSVLKRTDKANDQRPLKSALKPFSPSKRGETLPLPAPTYFVMSPSLQQKDRSRFSRLSNLLSRTGSSNTDRTAMFSPLSRTASVTSGHSDRNNSKDLRQKRSIGWDKPLHHFDDARNNSAHSDVSDRVRQAKLAEGDVYEKAKMNIRRPPKGIKNWFDGFEISSDEDDVTPLADPQQANARQQSFEQDSRSSQQRSNDSRQANLPPKVERMLGHSVPATRPDHDSLHDRLVPADNTDRYDSTADDYFRFRDRTATPKAQPQVHRSTEYPSSHHTSTNSHASSFNDNSTDRSDQYYRGSDHYSSNSEAVINRASAVDLRRPAIPPRKMQGVQFTSNEPWQGETLPQFSAYPNASSRPPLPSHHSSSKFSSRSQKTLDDEHDDRLSEYQPHTTASVPSTRPRSHGRASARFPSSLAQSDSTGGVPIDALSADVQHTMAVTEEEMALLEMMRNKRAAMNKGNFPKGYRRALEREHEQLMQRRLLAQQTALKILRDQQQFYSQRSETEETMDTTDLEEDEHEIMRLDKLRLEELNRTLRLEKFLASNASLAAALQETGLHRAEPQMRSRGLRQSQSDLRRPRLGTRTPSHQQDEDRANANSRAESRSAIPADGYVSPLDFPSPPAYSEDRHDRQKKSHRSSMKSTSTSTRHLATLEEDDRLSAALERAQRKARNTLANRSTDDELVQQELNRLRAQLQLQHKTQSSPERARKKASAATFLQSISDYQSADYRSITSRGTSVNASAVSPLTPSSLEPREVDKHPAFGPVDSDDELRYALGNSSSPELNFSKPARGMSSSTSSGDRRKSKKQYPSALAMIADEERRGGRDSMESSGSAGGDVLAAWAELGGAEGSLPGRRPLAR